MSVHIRQIQRICHQRHNRSGRQQKERRAKHNRAIKYGEFRVLGPRIEPHQQKRNDEILQHHIYGV